MAGSPLLDLLVHVLAVAAFVAFVIRWNSLFYHRIEPVIRKKSSDLLGIPILRRGTIRRYFWASVSRQPRDRWLVFFWAVGMVIVFGLAPVIVALLAVGWFLALV